MFSLPATYTRWANEVMRRNEYGLGRAHSKTYIIWVASIHQIWIHLLLYLPSSVIPELMAPITHPISGRGRRRALRKADDGRDLLAGALSYIK